MPINRERFDAIRDDDAATTAERIIEFLFENRDHAFTRGEIAAAIDRSPNTVGTNLSRLKKRNLVQHKDRYWMITDDLDQINDAVQFSNLLSGLTERFGPLIHDEDDAQAWAEAQPDEPHPSEQEDADTASTDPASVGERELED